MTAKFAKLKDGSWGIRVENEKPIEGKNIVVTKKDGSQEIKEVSKILWKDPNSLTYLCSLSGPTPRAHSVSGIGKYCAECGEKIKKPSQRCWETGMDCYPG